MQLGVVTVALYTYRISWRHAGCGAEYQTWERRAPNAEDALTMWREENYSRRAHPDNQPYVSRIEIVDATGETSETPTDLGVESAGKARGGVG